MRRCRGRLRGSERRRRRAKIREHGRHTGGTPRVGHSGTLRVPPMFGHLLFSVKRTLLFLRRRSRRDSGSDVGARFGAWRRLVFFVVCLYLVSGAVNVGEGGQRSANMGGTRGVLRESDTQGPSVCHPCWRSLCGRELCSSFVGVRGSDLGACSGARKRRLVFVVAVSILFRGSECRRRRAKTG